MPSPPGERIQKALAASGHGSRRDIEAWIEAGRITVDGKPAHIGQRLSGRERVYLDGRKLDLEASAEHRHLMYYKPVGEVNSRRDEKGRKTVFSRLPSAGNARWISVGRLDITTQGLLLLTTDGELANRLMHPSYELDRRYAVRVMGKLTAQQLQKLREGVELEDGPARFNSIVPQKADLGDSEDGANSWYQVTLQEGRNREVRRMFETVNMTVSRLIRVGYGPLALDRRLVRGRFRPLTTREAAQLYTAVRMSADGKPLPVASEKPAEQPRGKTTAGGPRRNQAGGARKPAGKPRSADSKPGKPRRPQPDAKSTGNVYGKSKTSSATQSRGKPAPSGARKAGKPARAGAKRAPNRGASKRG
jgi:23S rRNA pseudouridine2605 synthase